MITILSLIKEYLLFICSLGTLAKFTTSLLVLNFITLLILDISGYSARIIRGSRSTIRFFRDKGWVDNSNVSSFINKCLRRFPYIIRANYNLYSASDKPLTDYIGVRHYNERDYALREKTIKYLYDFVLITVAVITIIHIMNVWNIFIVFRYLTVILFAILLRYILMGSMMYREIKAKKLYLSAVDLMANGIFLNKVKMDDDISSVEYLENCAADNIKIERISESEGIIIDSNKPEVLDIAVDKTH